MATASRILLLLTVAAHVWAQGRGGGFRQPDPIDFNDHSGFVQIFDGASLNTSRLNTSPLNTWDGDPKVWKVEDGVIVGVSPADKPVGTTFLIWRGGAPADFELKLELKVEGAGANTGIQYRSKNITPSFGRGPGGRGGGQAGRGFPPPPVTDPRWDLAGYQADFDMNNLFSGQLMESSSARFIMTWRGQVVKAEPGKTPRLLASLGDKDALSGFVKLNGWNQYHIVARGHQLMHIVNGHLMSITYDDDPVLGAAKGLIGLQIEGNGGVKVSFRNLWLKTL